MYGYESRLVSRLAAFERKQVEALLSRYGLVFEGAPDRTALVEDCDEKIVATASIEGCVVKMVAADPELQGEGLADEAVLRIRQYALEKGLRHLFLYTKPAMAEKFRLMGFSELARTGQAALLECGRPSADDFKKELAAQRFSGGADFGSVVMNCNPFTLGHRYLIEKALQACGGLYVIVVQEDASEFPFADRLRLVREGTCDLARVRVLASGGYAVSRATFPSYFLKDRCDEALACAQTELDLALFAGLFVPALGISRRFVGTEPFSRTTALYNEQMKRLLPQFGVEVQEFARTAGSGAMPISASRVRKAVAEGDSALLKQLLPQTTLDFLASPAGRSVAERLRGAAK